VKASVCIPFSDQARLVGPVLSALAAQDVSPDEFEVIASPGKPGDGVVETLALFTNLFPLTTLPEPEHTLNRSENRNRAVEAASGDVMVFLDGDVLAESGLVSAHLRLHRTRRNVIGSGYVRMACDTDRLNAHMARRGRRYADGQILPARSAHTQNLSVRREDFERLGGFDERFTVYGGEDTDFGFRTVASGLSVVHVADARARHLHSYTLERLVSTLGEYGRHTLPMLASLHPAHARSLRGDVAAGTATPLRRLAFALAVSGIPWSVGLALARAGFGPAIEYVIRAAPLRASFSDDTTTHT
jgi:glycosyltransferase involved in cell wall biosynthesis